MPHRRRLASRALDLRADRRREVRGLQLLGAAARRRARPPVHPIADALGLLPVEERERRQREIHDRRNGEQPRHPEQERPDGHGRGDEDRDGLRRRVDDERALQVAPGDLARHDQKKLEIERYTASICFGSPVNALPPEACAIRSSAALLA
ncbi:hypothetical protein LRS13_10130 [Svornostia abyssi]|uniref:Uncharacterized protein n=1 Tax=Svornostia abyssi TaxID=2898438 RepID=A0ABY5PMC4_9ACTN|nr:hypothetical protein LRS13_10130 [Parviterribacteraceae bacterium J379]